MNRKTLQPSVVKKSLERLSTAKKCWFDARGKKKQTKHLQPKGPEKAASRITRKGGGKEHPFSPNGEEGGQ